jgi:UDP-4-amino-4,6-dideoxy-N-acetyl-beta-L-altrosamine transaminase
MISYGHQSINQEDINAVVEVLKSEHLTQGTMVPKFEQAICDYTTSEYAVAVNSATSALHIACKALGLQKGDILWTSPITFVASANCAKYCHADVDFVDINPDTFNIDISSLKNKLEEAKRKDNLPKILIPVHLGGASCEMSSIKALADQYGFHVIEDASHAIGGKYKTFPIGSCKYSDITIFSFHPVKIMTTGEGGIATTNNNQIAETMKLLRSHGITRQEALMEKESEGSWYYEQIELGYNYRMTDIQAALGISQLKRLDDFVSRRHEIVSYYGEVLVDYSVKSQYVPENCYSGSHLYIIRLMLDKIKKSRLRIFNEMRSEGIGVNVHYIPVHLQPYYQRMGFKQGDYPKAEEYYQQALTLPLYPDMTSQQVEQVTQTLITVIQ